MSRKAEIDLAWLYKSVQSDYRYDEKTFREAVEWADKTMYERIAKFLINYCPSAKDVESIIKNLKESIEE